MTVCPSSGNELLPYLSELYDSLRSTGLLLPLPAHLHRLCFGITGLLGRALDVDRILGIDFNIAIEVLLVRIFKHFVLKPIFGHTLTRLRSCPPALSVSMLLKSRFCLVRLASQHRPIRRADTRCQLRGLPPVQLRFVYRTFGTVHCLVVDDAAVDAIPGHQQHAA